MKPKVYLTRKLPSAVMERLNQETDLAWNQEDRVASPNEIILGLQNREGLLCTINDRIDAKLLEQCQTLKVVANFGVGFNHIDVPAATARKIPVTNTPDVLTDATADMAFALLLAVARRLGEGERLLRAGCWTGWEPMQLLGADVSGSTLGIVGFGRIGQAVARRARGFDMKVLYWNRTPRSEAEEHSAEATFMSLDELLRGSDFISLHVPYNPSTHHLLGANQLSLMKPSAFLINAARGPIVDEAALVRFLRDRKIAGAGLDVYEREPTLAPGLAELKNVVLAPHLGSATIGTRTRMGMIAVDNLLTACAGRRPPNCVNPEVLNTDFS
jgi:glyoxylate reductase